MELLIAYDKEYNRKVMELEDWLYTSMKTVIPFALQDIDTCLQKIDASPLWQEYRETKSILAYLGLCDLLRDIPITYHVLCKLQRIFIDHDLDIKTYRKLIKLGNYFREVQLMHEEQYKLLMD